MIDYLALGMKCGALAIGCLGVFVFGCMIIATLLSVVNGIAKVAKENGKHGDEIE